MNNYSNLIIGETIMKYCFKISLIFTSLIFLPFISKANCQYSVVEDQTFEYVMEKSYFTFQSDDGNVTFSKFKIGEGNFTDGTTFSVQVDAVDHGGKVDFTILCDEFYEYRFLFSNELETQLDYFINFPTYFTHYLVDLWNPSNPYNTLHDIKIYPFLPLNDEIWDVFRNFKYSPGLQSTYSFYGGDLLTLCEDEIKDNRKIFQIEWYLKYYCIFDSSILKNSDYFSETYYKLIYSKETGVLLGSWIKGHLEGTYKNKTVDAILEQKFSQSETTIDPFVLGDYSSNSTNHILAIILIVFPIFILRSKYLKRRK